MTKIMTPTEFEEVHHFVLSDPDKATLAEAKKTKQNVEVTTKSYPFGTYLMGLRLTA